MSNSTYSSAPILDTADETYKKRLAEWISEEVQAAGSYAKLALRIAIVSKSDLSGETLRSWHKGKIGRDGLNPRSLEAIARYRGMTRDEVRGWLEGKTRKDEVLYFIQTADPSDLEAVLRVGLERLHKLQGIGKALDPDAAIIALNDRRTPALSA